MEKTHVRTVASGDLHALTDLYNHYVNTSPATFDLEPAVHESRRQWMNRYSDAGPHRLLVANVGDAIAGYATSGRLREKPSYLSSVETTVCTPRTPRARGRHEPLRGALCGPGGRKFGRYGDVQWFERSLP